MYQIIGIENVNFKRDGNEYRGTRIHTTFERDNVDGLCVEQFYCNSSVDIEGLSLGDICEIYYNRYGKVSHIKKVG